MDYTYTGYVHYMDHAGYELCIYVIESRSCRLRELYTLWVMWDMGHTHYMGHMGYTRCMCNVGYTGYT